MSQEKLINNDINKEHQEFSKKIGEYILLDQIGQGTFSKVTRAFHILSEQIVAVKILNKEQIEDEIDMERINREIEILKNIYHPNICQIYETYSTIHNYYLMMEYVEGGDLFDYISEKSFLSESKACYFFRQLISVMEYLSSLGICHRDIKPENILLTDNYSQIKVIDFGLSNFCENNELLHSSCGSPCYAPPEMLTGEKYNGLGTDIWSAGIVLYSMLVGALPFDDVELKRLYEQIKEGKFYIPSTLSLEAIDLLKQILRVDPEKRITIKEIKKHKWFNLEQNVMYKGVNIYIDKMPCDIEVIKYVIKNYFSQDNNISLYNFVRMVKGYSCNKYTATYYLVKKYVLKNEGINEKENEIINDNYKKVYKEIKETKDEINNKIKNNKCNRKVIIKRNLEHNSSNFYDYDDNKGNLSAINTKNNCIFLTTKNDSQNINKNTATIATDNKDKEKHEQTLNNDKNDVTINNKIKIKRKKKEKNVVLIGQQNLKNDKKYNQKNKVIKKPDDNKIGLTLGFSLINIEGMNEKQKIPGSITDRNVAEKCRFSNYINKIYSSTNANTSNSNNNNSNFEIRNKSIGKKQKNINSYLNKVISPKKSEHNYFYVINNIINKEKQGRKKRTKNELFNLEINSNINRKNYLTTANNENIIVNINNNNYINNSMNRNHFQNLSLENSNQLIKPKEIKSKVQSPKNDNNKKNNYNSHIKVNLKSSKDDLKHLTSPKNKNTKRNRETNSSRKKKLELNIFSNKLEKIYTFKKRNTEKVSPSTIHNKINKNKNITSNIVKCNTNILCKNNNLVNNKGNKNIINKEKIRQTVINHRKIKSLYNEKNMLFDYFSDNKNNNKKNKNHKRNISSVFHFYLSDNKNDFHSNYRNTVSNNKKIDEINENNYTLSYSEEKRVKNKIMNKTKSIGQKRKAIDFNLKNNNNNDLNSYILDKLKRNKLMLSHNISQTKKNNNNNYFAGLNQSSSSNNYYLIDNIQKINKIRNDTNNISLNNPK